MNKEPNVEDAGDDKYRKIGSVRRLFEQFNRNYYKPKAIDRGFAGEVNNYIKYMSKRDKDEKLCFQQSIIAGLNYNNIKEKELKKILKSRRVDTDFSSHQRDWKNFEQDNNLVALNVLFVSYNREEIKHAYKSIYNKPKNQVILLMINDEANNYYYFAIRNL